MNVEAEVYLMMSCDNPNIVKYYNTYHQLEKNVVWIIMEYLEGGSLADAARAMKLTDYHIAYSAREILQGISYLHSKNFAHRDLKSTNVMISLKGEVKIIDLGLCADFSEGPRTKMLGSAFWIPPEMILKKPHSLPVDIWSLAVCMMELYLGNPPHSVSALKCMYNVFTKGLEDVIPSSASPLAKDFLTKCLVMDPDKRATASELLKHPWVNLPKLGEGFSDILAPIFLNNYLTAVGM